MKNNGHSGLFVILLVYAAFIALGLPDSLMGVAWPSIRAELKLPIDAIGLLMVTLTAGYLVSSFYCGRLIFIFGVGKILAASCLLTGMALAGYCVSGSWALFVALGTFAGFGAGLIDSGLNTYVAANLGKKHMHWLHASFGLGATLGPLIMTTAINRFHNWRGGYVTVSVLQVLLAACFLFTLKSWNAPKGSAAVGAKFTDYDTPVLKTLSHPPVWASLLIFFLYTGVEGTVGFWAYTILTESRHIAPSVAGIWTGIYWGTFTLGRVFAGFYSKRLSINALVRLSLFAGLCGAVIFRLNISAALNLAGLILTGLAIAPIFPSLVSGTAGRVGDIHAGNTIGMQMAAAGLGIAVIPALAGVIAGKFSPEAIPLFLTGLFAATIVVYMVFVRDSKIGGV